MTNVPANSTDFVAAPESSTKLEYSPMTQSAYRPNEHMSSRLIGSATRLPNEIELGEASAINSGGGGTTDNKAAIGSVANGELSFSNPFNAHKTSNAIQISGKNKAAAAAAKIEAISPG